MSLVPTKPLLIEEEHGAHFNPGSVAILRPHPIPTMDRRLVYFADGAKIEVKATMEDMVTAFGADFIKFSEVIDGVQISPEVRVNRRRVKCISRDKNAAKPLTLIHCTGSVLFWGPPFEWTVRVDKDLAAVLTDLQHT